MAEHHYTVTCSTHSDRAAIESCEVCDKPLCGHCLWYSGDGRRICEDHARTIALMGIAVEPPATYAEAIREDPVLTRGSPPGPIFQSGSTGSIYQGNSQDLSAFLAAILGAITIFSCMGGIYCLPIVGTILGILAFTNSKHAVEPRRTRILAGIGIGVGTFLLLLVVLYALLIVGLIIIALLAGSGP
jgi:hypothetical protein